MQISVDALDAACETAVVTVGNWEWDFASGALTWSDGLRALLNVDAKTTPSFELFLSRVHPNDRERCEAAIAATQQSGQTVNFHFRLAPDGAAVRWLANKAEVFKSSSGTPSWAAGTIFDFTEIREAQLAIERREQHYRALVAADSLGEWAATPHGRITRASFWRAFTGRRRRQDLGEFAWLDAVHVDDRAQVAALWQETLRLECASELTFRLAHHSGEFRWIHIKAVPISDEHGRLVEWVGSAKDVQAARDAEEMLRVTEKRVGLALSAARMMTWDYDLSTGFVRRSGNSVEMLGIDSCHIDELVSFVHPQDVALVLASLRRTADTGHEHRMEYRLMTRDGSATKWIRAYGKLHRGGLTGSDRIIGISIDVTEEKRAEAQAAAALKDMECANKRFEALQRTSGDIVWTAAPDGRVEDMPSWRAYTGQSQDQVKGWGWMCALHPADRERVRNAVQAQSQSAGYCEVEYRIRQHTGRYEWFLARAAPVVGEGGEPVEWIGTCSRMRVAPSGPPTAKEGDSSCGHAAPAITGAQVRAARALLRWSVQVLSLRSGVSISTIRRTEDQADDCPNRERRMLQMIQNTLEDAGVCFGPVAGGGAGVSLNPSHDIRSGMRAAAISTLTQAI